MDTTKKIPPAPFFNILVCMLVTCTVVYPSEYSIAPSLLKRSVAYQPSYLEHSSADKAKKFIGLVAISGIVLVIALITTKLIKDAITYYLQTPKTPKPTLESSAHPIKYTIKLPPTMAHSPRMGAYRQQSPSVEKSTNTLLNKECYNTINMQLLKVQEQRAVGDQASSAGCGYHALLNALILSQDEPLDYLVEQLNDSDRTLIDQRFGQNGYWRKFIIGTRYHHVINAKATSIVLDILKPIEECRLAQDCTLNISSIGYLLKIDEILSKYKRILQQYVKLVYIPNLERINPDTLAAIVTIEKLLSHDNTYSTDSLISSIPQPGSKVTFPQLDLEDIISFIEDYVSKNCPFEDPEMFLHTSDRGLSQQDLSNALQAKLKDKEFIAQFFKTNGEKPFVTLSIEQIISQHNDQVKSGISTDMQYTDGDWLNDKDVTALFSLESKCGDFKMNNIAYTFLSSNDMFEYDNIQTLYPETYKDIEQAYKALHNPELDNYTHIFFIGTMDSHSSYQATGHWYTVVVKKHRGSIILYVTDSRNNKHLLNADKQKLELLTHYLNNGLTPPTLNVEPYPTILKKITLYIRSFMPLT
ncbi:hypothetical protein J120_01720 [candidate division TM6 bacterium JCVI TM6SC1]|uniref:Uncharacterized protein n=1 Tax=candidate division TM6 bacterium JCVI TM6SC1 TaxID=1306947 RepID=A0A0D2K5X8_9BACT|nr:hypothetical protein J120_01720 [candidate division TM6 bacterium JCVI TM6SC1]